MSIVIKKKNQVPTISTDFFETGKMFPGFYDFNNDFFDLDKQVSFPETNIMENEKEFNLELAIPGMEKKDVKVEFQDGILTISAKKEKNNKTEINNYKRYEFSYYSYYRSFTLPENTISDKIDAKHENGLLKILIPKKEVTLSKSNKEIKVS